MTRKKQSQPQRHRDTEKTEESVLKNILLLSFSVSLCLCGWLCFSSFDHIAAKFRSICKPTRWLFSGWNCVANTLSFHTAAQNGVG